MGAEEGEVRESRRKLTRKSEIGVCPMCGGEWSGHERGREVSWGVELP